MADFTPHEAVSREPTSLPVMLPVKLIDRDLVLAKIYGELKNNAPVLIYGPAGIGKTALAATLASAYTDLAGGVLWIHVDQPTLADLLVHVGRAYGVREIVTSENPLGMVGAVAAMLTAEKPLIVLDGKIDPAVAQEFFNRCAENLPGLVVSEDQLTGPWMAISLDRLDASGAVQMFNLLAGLDGANGEEDDADVRGLVNVLDFNPFAIAVAAGAVKGTNQTPAQFLGALPQQAGLSAQLLALSAAFRALNGALQGLMFVLGATFKGEATAQLLSLIGGAPVQAIEQAMSMLSQRHLVSQFKRGGVLYYRMHPITHSFMQPVLRGSNKLDALQAKTRDALLQYTQTYGDADNPDFTRLAAEMENLLAAARWAVDQGNRDFANQLAAALMQAGDFVNSAGYVHELLILRKLAAGSTSAFPANPAPAVVAAASVATPAPAASMPLDDLDDEDLSEDDLDDEDDYLPFVEDDDTDEAVDEEGNDLDDEDTFDDDEDLPDLLVEKAEEDLSESALIAAQTQEPGEIMRLRQSLAQAKQQGNKHRQAEILNQIGQAQIAASMENEAIASFSEALDTYEEISDQPGMLTMIEVLASLTARTDNLQAAVLHATRGASIAEQQGKKPQQARLLTLLGDARQALGESEQAVAAYSLALTVGRSLPEPQDADVPMIMLKLGYAQLDENLPQAAVSTWEESLKLFRSQDRRDCEGRVLGGLGSAYGELARWTESISFHTSALHIAREVKDKEDEALQLSNLGYALVQGQQLGQAVLRYRQALHLAYLTNSRDNIVSTIVDLVRLLAESRRHLSVAELLIDDALKLEPNDRDARKLKERITAEKSLAMADGVELIQVNGTAQDYAANAYKLLD